MLADRSPYGASFLVGSPAFRIILAASCNNNGRISPLCFRAPSSSASAVMVVGAHDEQVIFDGNGDDQRPEDQRQTSERRFRGKMRYRRHHRRHHWR
jgi:hypothetical protein